MTSLHVRHNFTPIHAREALLLLQKENAANHTELLSRAQARGLALGDLTSSDKVVASHRDLGFVFRGGKQAHARIELTPLGNALASLAAQDPMLFVEIVHLRYWWLWSLDTKTRPSFSWSYRRVTELLWEEAPTTIDSDHLVAVIQAEAEEQFGRDSTSFSSSSVLGVLHWLRALSPPCVTGRVFARRPGCPAEALLISLEALYVTQGRPLGVPIRLHPGLREQLSRASLLDESALDDVLAQAVEALGLIRRTGDGGDFVILRERFLPGFISEEGVF